MHYTFHKTFTSSYPSFSSIILKNFQVLSILFFKFSSFTMYTLYNLPSHYQIVEIFHILQLFWCMLICSVDGWMDVSRSTLPNFFPQSCLIHRTIQLKLQYKSSPQVSFSLATTITKCCKSCTLHHVAQYKLSPPLLQHDTSAANTMCYCRYI